MYKRRKETAKEQMMTSGRRLLSPKPPLNLISPITLFRSTGFWNTLTVGKMKFKVALATRGTLEPPISRIEINRNHNNSCYRNGQDTDFFSLGL